jgi:UDP-N-acetylglucosamine--N-acetylmuramyl-(pentapeptide) pyrophosphoryl-undecaprenol N-acetylglucosamine transferase
VISRAGANSLYELLALKKPHILIPLPTLASRGDQIDNAAYFEAAGMSVVIPEETLEVSKLIKTVAIINEQLETYQNKLHTLNYNDATPYIFNLIKNLTGCLLDPADKPRDVELSSRDADIKDKDPK